MTSHTRQDSTRLRHRGSVASDDLTHLGGHCGHFATGPWESKEFGVTGTLCGEWQPASDRRNDLACRQRVRECQTGLMGYR